VEPKEAEVRAIEAAHRAAQARLGVAGAYLAMAEWGSVNPLAAGATSAYWVARSLRMINAIRRKSTRLAVSYIRLVRALETGYTLGYPEYSDDPDTLTMGVLRTQFRDLLLEIADVTKEASKSTDADEKWFESELRRIDEQEVRRPGRILMADTNIDREIQDWLDASLDNDDDDVTPEEFDWGSEMTPDDIEEAFEKVLNDDIVKVAEERARALQRDEANARIAAYRKKLKESHDTAGSVGGGYVDHYGISAGRQITERVVRGDKRVRVFARGCRPGACAFCAMLAANGYYYRDKVGALFTSKKISRNGNDVSDEMSESSPDMDSGLRRFHKNCKCFVIVRYIDNPDLPEQNAYFQEKWKTVTAGLHYTTDPKTRKGTNNALNAWRKWLNQERRKEGTYNPRNR